MSKDEWAEIHAKLANQLSEEEHKIVAALADGKSMPDIGRMLGQHRSMIWRKIQRLRERLGEIHQEARH